MKFYFPLPDHSRSFTLIGASGSGEIWRGEGWRIEKGFLNGSIDLVFEWNGKVYLLDWKSNQLEKYTQSGLDDVMREHYRMQLQIYALATVRWLRLVDEAAFEGLFGGVLYVFLRGMPETEAVYFERPSWRDLKRYESELQDPFESGSLVASA